MEFDKTSMVDYFRKLRHANRRKVYKGTFRRTTMVGASSTDGQSWITIIDGSLLEPEASTRDDRGLRSRATEGEHARRLKEEHTARELTYYARRLAHYRHYRTKAFNERSPSSAVPLDTWLLGPPNTEHAKFAPWFDDEEEGTDYRILIHRSPLQYGGIALSSIWDGIYLSNRRELNMKRKRTKNDRFKEIAYSFMREELFPAYLKGDAEVESVIAAAGHGYFHHSVP